MQGLGASDKSPRVDLTFPHAPSKPSNVLWPGWRFFQICGTLNRDLIGNLQKINASKCKTQTDVLVSSAVVRKYGLTSASHSPRGWRPAWSPRVLTWQGQGGGKGSDLFLERHANHHDLIQS